MKPKNYEQTPGAINQANETNGFVFNQTMLRIKDPERSLRFYRDVLGMVLLKQLDFPEMKFTLFFLGYLAPADGPVPSTAAGRTEFVFKQRAMLELTHNWGTETEAGELYHNGNADPRGFGHIGLSVPDVTRACERFDRMGVTFVKRPEEGSMKGLAFIQDPDGYWVEILEANSIAMLCREAGAIPQTEEDEENSDMGLFKRNQKTMAANGSPALSQTKGSKIDMSKLPNHYDPVEGRAVELDDLPWVPFPEAFSDGGIRWKLLNVAPELGSWAAIFDCPAGSSFASHHHIGPGEYFLTKGRMEVRGGENDGGETVTAPAYGYEPCQAFHGRTFFPIDSEFYMTFLGPLQMVAEENGDTLALVTWQAAQAVWEASVEQASAGV